MRCAATLFVRRHDAMARQKRDDTGRVIYPHRLVWECRRCGKDVGETALKHVAAEASSPAALERRPA